jgi:putative FmdB family regulatory protein
MPIYAYKCKSCEHRFEARQRFSDNPLTECPECDGNIRRVISPVGVVFKGSGFYVTDNRNGKSNGAIMGSSKNQDGDKASKSGESEKNKTTGSEKSNVVAEKNKGSSNSAESSSPA